MKYKMNIEGLITILMCFIIVSFIFKMYGTEKCDGGTYGFWDLIIVPIFVSLIFYLGKYSKIKIK